MGFRWNGWNCALLERRYGNDRLALMIVDEDDGSSIGVATVNLPEADLAPGEILIKTWSENAGLLEAMISAGIIEDTGKRVPTGFVEAAVCRMGSPR